MEKTKKESRIGVRIRRERERLGFTQVQFAKAIGVGRLASIHYELGNSSPNVDTLLRMQAIGVDISYVLNGVDHSALLDPRSMEKAVDLLLKMIFDLQAKPDAKVMSELLLHFYRSIRTAEKVDNDVGNDFKSELRNENA